MQNVPGLENVEAQVQEGSPQLAVFVDREGECIDYVSSVDPYEAKVAVAHMLVLMEMLASSRVFVSVSAARLYASAAAMAA